jgi:hypothetical protein
MLALGLLANEVVKVFFWTPHTQMFNVLAPLACVAAAAHALEHPLLASGPAVALGILAGAESLAYGTFLMVPVCFAVGALAAGARTGRARASLGTVAAVLAGFAAPLLGWYLTVVAVAGSFYSDETARFGHLVWVAEAIADGAAAFELRFLLHLRKQLAAVATADVHVVALLTVAASLAMLSGVRRRTLAPEARRMLLAAGIALSLLFLFLTLLGSHPTRLAWSIVPPMLVATGVLLGSARERLRPWERRALDLSLSTWSIAWLVWEMRHGYPLA